MKNFSGFLFFLPAFLLTLIGLVSAYSFSLMKDDFFFFKKQFFLTIFALLIFVLFSLIDYRVLKTSYLIFFIYVVVILLLLGLFFLSPQTRGTKSWYQFGYFSLDPSELAKFLVIIFLAKYFSTKHIEMYRLFHIGASGFLVFLPAVLIFFQPNFGSALLLIGIWIGVLLISGIKLNHFLIILGVFLLIGIFSWNFLLKDYQKQRIVSFLLPSTQNLGSGWQQFQSKIAIGSGGFWGLGFAKGFQVKYGFLPEAQTDFVFAKIAEEFGFLGIVILLSLFLILLWKILKLAMISQDNFSRLFCGAFAVSLFLQISINIGMNLGLLPVVGIPLPFLSYGGSNLVINYLCLGILQNILKKSSFSISFQKES